MVGTLFPSPTRKWVPGCASLPLQQFTSAQSSNLPWASDSEDWPNLGLAAGTTTSLVPIEVLRWVAPRNARSRDSCNGLTAKPQSSSGKNIVGLKYFLTLSRSRKGLRTGRFWLKAYCLS